MQNDNGDNDAVFHPELGVNRIVALGNGVLGSLNIYVNANPFFKFYTHLVIHSLCAASTVGNSLQGGLGLSGLVHEDAHPRISYHN